MTFSGDRRLSTWAGPVDVDLHVRQDGSASARIVNVEEHPQLADVGGAIGATEDEAVAQLAEAIDALRPVADP